MIQDIQEFSLAMHQNMPELSSLGNGDCLKARLKLSTLFCETHEGCKEVQGGARRCKEVQGGARRCKEVQGGARRCKEVQGGAWMCKVPKRTP